MSRIKLLLDVIEDVRSLSDSLQSLANAMASDEPIEQPKTTSESKPKVRKYQDSTLLFQNRRYCL